MQITIESEQYLQTADSNVQVEKEGVLIIYGNGAELGDFGQFAKSLQKEKEKSYEKEYIIIESIQNKNTLMQYLLNFSKFKIAELHIFSHASGGGLYLGYHNQESGDSRNAAYNFAENIEKRKITYEEVVNAEIGALLTDDLVTTTAIKNQSTYRLKFGTNKPFIKLWGCNAGISDWVYSDSAGLYYWSALNEKNTPKPAIAQAVASFFNVDTFGAKSGSHIEFSVGGKWQILAKQPAKHNGIRLHPDRGDYNIYKP